MPDQPTAEPRPHAFPGQPLRAAALATALIASAASPAMAGDSAPPPTPVPAQTARQLLDERYVVGPTAADAFGYRIVWQTASLVTLDAKMQVVNVDADSVWFGDSNGSIARLRRDSGETVWRGSTFQGLERLLTVEHQPRTDSQADRVYAITEINCVALDAANGTLVKRSPFAQAPSTVPTVYADYMIWGTNNGLITWFQFGTGFQWRATAVGGLVTARPTLHDGIVVAGGGSGTVMAIDASDARTLWTRKLAGGIAAPIACDGRAAFVASRDQSLWAFDMVRGRVLWQYFTQSPLLNEPVVIADGLYLQIPDQGLVSFEPHPENKPDGVVRWKSAAAGTVIGRLGTNLLAWDQPTRTLTFVDAGTGRVVETRAMPQVEWIQANPPVNGDLWVASTDGRVEHLEPLARPTMAEQTAKAGAPAAPKADVAAPEAKPAADATAPKADPPSGGGNGMQAATQQPLNPRLR